MAQEQITTFPFIEDISTTDNLPFNPAGINGGSFMQEFKGDIYTSRGRFGNGSAYIDISAVSIKSNNFVSGSAGWQILYSGDVEFNTGTFRGSLEAGSIHIPDTTSANSFHTNDTGNSWWGCNVADFASDNDNANAYILNTGQAKFQNSILGGTSDVIIDTLDTSSKKILADFNFGTTDYAGAVKSGDITWNTSTGAITGGSGVVVYRKGIVGANAGVTTFSIDATTGDATFAGTLSAASGTLGTVTSAIIRTAVSGQRIEFTDADDSLTLYDASENTLFKLFDDGNVVAGVFPLSTATGISVNVAGVATGIALSSVVTNASNSTFAGRFRSNGTGSVVTVIALSNASRTAASLDIDAISAQGAHINMNPIASAPQTPSEGDLYADTDNLLYYYDGSAWVSLITVNTDTALPPLKAGEDLVLGNAVYISTGGLGATKTIENTSGSAKADIYGARWGGQTFSFNEEFTVTTIGLVMRKEGSPTGNLVLEVFATDGAGAPTGGALGSDTVSATAATSFAIKTFTLDTPTPLDANTVYIVTIKAVDTSVGNRLEWQRDDGGNPYAGGSQNYSIDSGANWTLATSDDFAFEINSHPRAGRLYKTDASFADERITGFIGSAGESITAGTNGSIVAAGVVAGASGLTVGGKVYLSDTPGAVSSSAGSNSKTVGLAYSATEVIINYSI